MAGPVLVYDKTIYKLKHLIRITGINIKYNKKPKDKYRSIFVFIFNFIWINTDIAAELFWFVDGIQKNKNFTELTYIAPCVIAVFLSHVKVTYLVIHESIIDKLTANIRKFENQLEEREQNSETERIINTEDNYVNKVIRTLTIVYVSLIICFALNPILLMAIQYYTTNQIELLLPFLVLYPFDPFQMKYYPWVYLHHVWAELAAIVGFFVSECMAYIFCTYLRTQFLLLSYYIEHLIPQESNQEYDSKEISLKLVELVKWHQEIISSVDLLEKLYTRSTLLNFVTSSILICLTGFNVMVIDDTVFVLTFIFFLLISLSQIFFQCSFGNLLMESSMEVGEAIYKSRWYVADLSLRKSMLIILIRAQTPCKLTASHYADVNLNAFMKVCSTSWSYFALLQTMYTPSQ